MMKRLAMGAMGVCAAAIAAHGGSFDLRFYGKGDAKEETLAGGVKRLTIDAESDGKAKLWQAKFISDLQMEGRFCRPVKLEKYFGLKKMNAFRVNGGWMAAVRDGSRVTIWHAPTSEALTDAAEGWNDENTKAAAEVPMGMDALEKYAFRFYYRYECSPEGIDGYDQRKDVDFCRTNGLGLVFWTSGHWADHAAGVPADNQWGRLIDECHAAKVPVVLNFNSTPFAARDYYGMDMNSRQPGYMGGFVRFGNPQYGGASHLSVDHRKANAHGYEANRKIIEKYGKENLISLQEVNGELSHGDHNVYLNYGPEADKSFREYLKRKYGSIGNYSRLLYGEGGEKKLKSWEDVHFPEMAEFAGWKGKGWQDLAGRWRIKYTENPVEADFAEAAPPDAEKWALTGVMPGSDEQLFYDRKTAVLRREFEWNGEGRTWLYLWDLNKKFKDNVEVWLNGKLLKREPVAFNFYHWMNAEATGLLKKGKNTIALRLPWGIIGYKVYLTGEEPKFYPFAGRRLNRLWLDSIDWNTERRLTTIKDSMNAVRAANADQSVVLMAPRAYSRQLREIARLRGGRFHDTGGMGACFHEKLPMLMRGANLPFTLEPGGPATTEEGFRRLMGLYMSEGINAIHYFIHIGNVTWDEKICKAFLEMLPALKMLGKSRQLQGDVAWVIDSDINKYLGYPWCSDYNVAFPSGYWAWRFNMPLRDYQMDAIIPDDFSNGLADRYKVVLDCNNSIMTREGVDAIRKWVEKGGTYVAMFQTGRHSRMEADAWAISRLTGYRGKVFARYESDGGIVSGTLRECRLTEAGKAESATWKERYRDTGTALERTAEDAVDLAKWDDGSVAIGKRKVGKGTVYVIGLQLSEHCKGHGIRHSELVKAILDGRGARTDGFTASAKYNSLETKRFTANNGLFDVWYVWNSDWKNARDYEIKFDDGIDRELTDVLTGEKLPKKGRIAPSGFVMGMSPRIGTADAASVWFDRQCGDNQGTAKEPFGPPRDGYGDNVLDATDGWTVNGVPGMRLGMWETGVAPGVTGNVNRAVRKVKLPERWKNGKVYLSHSASYDGTCFQRRRKDGRKNKSRIEVKVDGKQLGLPRGNEGFSLVELQGAKGGDELELEFLVESHGGVRYTGTMGSTFLNFIPDPKRTLPLAGEWEMRDDIMGTNGVEKVTLPNEFTNAGRYFGRTVKLDALAKGERAVLRVEDTAGAFGGVIVNGYFVRRHHHRYGRMGNVEVTPFLKEGENTFTIVTGRGRYNFKTVELRIYDDWNKSL